MPLVVSCAPSETDEFKRQSEAYMAAAMARGCPVRFVPAKHQPYDIVFGLAERESPWLSVSEAGTRHVQERFSLTGT